MYSRNLYSFYNINLLLWNTRHYICILNFKGSKNKKKKNEHKQKQKINVNNGIFTFYITNNFIRNLFYDRILRWKDKRNKDLLLIITHFILKVLKLKLIYSVLNFILILVIWKIKKFKNGYKFIFLNWNNISFICYLN